MERVTPLYIVSIMIMMSTDHINVLRMYVMQLGSIRDSQKYRKKESYINLLICKNEIPISPVNFVIHLFHIVLLINK